MSVVMEECSPWAHNLLVHVGDNDILDGPMSGYTNPVPDCSNQIILNR